MRYNDGKFSQPAGGYWTSTTKGEEYRAIRVSVEPKWITAPYGRNDGFNVRCIKD